MIAALWISSEEHDDGWYLDIDWPWLPNIDDQVVVCGADYTVTFRYWNSDNELMSVWLDPPEKFTQEFVLELRRRGWLPYTEWAAKHGLT